LGFHSGEERVYGANGALEVLARRSPWQSYILPNLKIAKSSRWSFTILPISQFVERTGQSRNVPGWTDKQTGEIIMQDWSGSDSPSHTPWTYLSAVLHELVHLVSHPPNQGAPHSTAMQYLGTGLLEGLVEVVTEDILTAQHIALARGRMRGHQERVPIVRNLMETTGIPFFARVLFEGDGCQLTPVMEFTYSRAGWNGIRAQATNYQTRMALDLIRDSRARQEEEHRRSAEATGAALRQLSRP
jgi:hypothetical protein